MKEKVIQEVYDYLAPDSSEIRLLPEMSKGGLAHCTLPEHATSSAVKHKTVEEIWYFMEGEGEVWRKSDREEKIVAVSSGYALTIPMGTHFQFRNTGGAPLVFIIVTMPCWPGADEAVSVEGKW